MVGFRAWGSGFNLKSGQPCILPKAAYIFVDPSQQVKGAEIHFQPFAE